MPLSINESSKTFLLFLPNKEWHEMGLLYSYYLLKKRGHKVIYLGASVPTEDLKEYTSSMTYDFLLTSINSANSFKDLQKFINSLSETFLNTTILISGYQLFINEANFPKNMIFIKSYEALIQFAQ
jgi:methanogenic corrinoid protein MtbC1